MRQGWFDAQISDNSALSDYCKVNVVDKIVLEGRVRVTERLMTTRRRLIEMKTLAV